jgi:predicted dehydrogenase
MTLKIAIIGAGAMLKYQAKGFQLAGAEMNCIADPNAQIAKQAAEAYGIPSVFESAEEMIATASNRFDAVSILTPPAYHKHLTVLALGSGKHVFCEKPPAMNAAEVSTMIEAAKKLNRHLMFDFNNRFRPESQEIIRRVRADFFGRINSAQAIWVRRSGIPAAGSWFTNRAISGGGALIDLLHMIDLSLYFMGYPDPRYVLSQSFTDFMDDPTRRSAYGVANGNDVVDVESATHAIITFETGQILHCRCSWAEMVKEERCFVSFQGQKAGAEVSRLYRHNGGETVTGTYEIYSQQNGESVDERPEVPFDGTMGRVAAARNFVEATLDKAEPLVDSSEAYKLMRIIDAIYLSAREKRPVKIDRQIGKETE